MVISSPSSRLSALRTLALIGTMYNSSLGHKEVCHSLLPMRTVTGIIPQPYVTILDMAFRSRLCPSGTVTKNHGEGPRQNQILPVNSIFIKTIHSLAAAELLLSFVFFR